MVLNKNKIKINSQIVAVLIGIVISLTTIFYVNAAAQDYFPKNSQNTVTVKISGPSGSSSMDILFQTPSHSYEEGKTDRAWFRNIK